MSPLMRNVEQMGIEALQLKRDPAQITSHVFFEGVTHIRRLFAQLINGDPVNVAITPATSYGIATIAKNLSLSSGDNIVLIDGQFPSNVYIWRRLSQRTGATIITVSDDGANWTKKVLEAINYRTAVVAMETVHWANGYPFNLTEISQRTHDVGAQLILDGTQSIGAVPFDVQEVNPDALVCAGYKWLLGPYGIALLYVGKQFHDGIPLEENWVTRDGSENLGNLMDYTDEYRPGATRFDRGQTNVFAQTAMMTEALRQVLEWQPAQIHAYCSQLIDPFHPQIRERGYHFQNSWLPHIFGIGLPEHVNHAYLNDELNRRKISISLRGNALRISPYVYNTSCNIEELQDVLLTAAK